MAHTSTVLSQLLKLFPGHEFAELARRTDGRRRQGALTRWSQFVALAVGQLAGRKSLRDIEMTLASQKHRHYHLGCQHVSKSSLARVNEKLDYQFYSALFSRLYQRCLGVSGKHKFHFGNKLFSLDGSLINVSMQIFPWADYNRKKAGFKLHVGLDHDGMIPAFANVTLGKISETSQARCFNFPKGSVLVFDRGYNDHTWHNSLTEQGIYFVSRLRGNALYEVLETHAVAGNTSILSDQTIRYSSKTNLERGLAPIRKIVHVDPETGKQYVFITNHFGWPASTIAEIYKQRWQVELFFKWIKQNLKIKTFLGASMNAVMTQIMAALCIYLLLAWMKFRFSLNKSMMQISRLLQVNLFQRRSLIELFKPPEPIPILDQQLHLGFK